VVYGEEAREGRMGAEFPGGGGAGARGAPAGSAARRGWRRHESLGVSFVQVQEKDGEGTKGYAPTRWHML
jgi:hypothetical protein